MSELERERGSTIEIDEKKLRLLFVLSVMRKKPIVSRTQYKPSLEPNLFEYIETIIYRRNLETK